MNTGVINVIQIVFLSSGPYNAVLMFSFEEASFEFTEAITGAHTVYVEMENYNSVIIPIGVSIQISALVGAMSNATQGNQNK